MDLFNSFAGIGRAYNSNFQRYEPALLCDEITGTFIDEHDNTFAIHIEYEYYRLDGEKKIMQCRAYPERGYYLPSLRDTVEQMIYEREGNITREYKEIEIL